MMTSEPIRSGRALARVLPGEDGRSPAILGAALDRDEASFGIDDRVRGVPGTGQQRAVAPRSTTQTPNSLPGDFMLRPVTRIRSSFVGSTEIFRISLHSSLTTAGSVDGHDVVADPLREGRQHDVLDAAGAWSARPGPREQEVAVAPPGRCVITRPGGRRLLHTGSLTEMPWSATPSGRCPMPGTTYLICEPPFWKRAKAMTLRLRVPDGIEVEDPGRSVATLAVTDWRRPGPGTRSVLTFVTELDAPPATASLLDFGRGPTHSSFVPGTTG